MPSLAGSELHVVLWQDIFTVFDGGKARPHEYMAIRDLIRRQAAAFPGGTGCLIVIPENATPPGDDARKALNATLESLGGSLRCLCWLVEGSGFQGAMVRAVLTGVRLIAARSYDTHVATDPDEALSWLLTTLHGTRPARSDVAAGRKQLMRDRRSA